MKINNSDWLTDYKLNSAWGLIDIDWNFPFLVNLSFIVFVIFSINKMSYRVCIRLLFSWLLYSYLNCTSQLLCISYSKWYCTFKNTICGSSIWTDFLCAYEPFPLFKSHFMLFIFLYNSRCSALMRAVYAVILRGLWRIQGVYLSPVNLQDAEHLASLIFLSLLLRC